MNMRAFLLSLAFGLTLALSGAAFAQGDQSKKMDCCASCCCKGDSCAMKDGVMKNHAGAKDKHNCCCGDSCAIKKEGAKTTGAANSDKHECCCSGDSCEMKDGAATNATAKPDKHESCCCGGDSCDMKMKDKKDAKDKS